MITCRSSQAAFLVMLLAYSVAAFPVLPDLISHDRSRPLVGLSSFFVSFLFFILFFSFVCPGFLPVTFRFSYVVAFCNSWLFAFLFSISCLPSSHRLTSICFNKRVLYFLCMHPFRT